MRLLPFAVLLAAFAPAAYADVFTVTRTDDPLPDACAPGDCSLREAMQAAAANDPFGETDTIVLSASTYTLVRGPLNDIHQRLHVQGAGSAQTHVVIGDDNASLFVSGSRAELALVGLGLDASGEYANAVSSSADSSLSLDDVVVENGTVSFGSGAAAEVRRSELRRGLYCYGEVLIEDSTIFNLYQMEPQEGAPAVTLRRALVDGTLYPDAPLASAIAVHAGTLTLQNSVVADSGFRIVGPATIGLADSTITRSYVNVEVAADAAKLNLLRMRYVDNVGPVRTEAAAEVAIEDSLFEGNLARALYAAGGAEWNVSGSSFVDNRVDGNAGGAIVLEDDSVLRIRNSTFSGNSFTVAAAQNGARGAAIGFRNGAGAHLIVVHSTIVAPAVMPAGIVGSAIGGHDNGIAVDIANSIVRGSCGMNAHLLQNNSGDIESPGNTCGLDTEQNYINVSSASLALGALADNGGRTPTILPGAGSLAINRAGAPQCLPTDQRGYARPGGARCDIGAVEADADDTLFADGFDG